MDSLRYATMHELMILPLAKMRNDVESMYHDSLWLQFAATSHTFQRYSNHSALAWMRDEMQEKQLIDVSSLIQVSTFVFCPILL